MAYFQPFTLQSAAATGYSLVNPPASPANTAALVCRSGEFWVRPYPVATTAVPTSGTLTGYTAATGVNTNVTSPITAPLTKGWIRMLPGDKQFFGDGLADPMAQIDVFCVVAGELLVSQH